ncbi:hypothetical protein TNIN_218541 [Trichonephila inaurata madagascariensis]|uniref:Uncharacterized protein n=1 Tax=Trichonephila inaurata madagascariensis TaxID=2747483 RepID=A0A8X6YRW7_9ARAC|nr:hypothetical protein TNIN_218541 [Trichonephila inaurata madagascariensis]
MVMNGQIFLVGMQSFNYAEQMDKTQRVDGRIDVFLESKEGQKAPSKNKESKRKVALLVLESPLNRYAFQTSGFLFPRKFPHLSRNDFSYLRAV